MHLDAVKILLTVMSSRTGSAPPPVEGVFHPSQVDLIKRFLAACVQLGLQGEASAADFAS